MADIRNTYSAIIASCSIVSPFSWGYYPILGLLAAIVYFRSIYIQRFPIYPTLIFFAVMFVLAQPYNFLLREISTICHLVLDIKIKPELNSITSLTLLSPTYCIIFLCNKVFTLDQSAEARTGNNETINRDVTV